MDIKDFKPTHKIKKKIETDGTLGKAKNGELMVFKNKHDRYEMWIIRNNAPYYVTEVHSMNAVINFVPARYIITEIYTSVIRRKLMGSIK
jgi:hypothetical protein